MDKRRVKPLDAHVCYEGEIEGKIKPGWIALEPSLTGTDLKSSRQQRLSSWKIQRNTADSCLLADGSSDLREPFPLKPLLG